MSKSLHVFITEAKRLLKEPEAEELPTGLKEGDPSLSPGPPISQTRIDRVCPKCGIKIIGGFQHHCAKKELSK